MPAFTLMVNGAHRQLQAAGDTPLLYVLRNDLALSGQPGRRPAFVLWVLCLLCASGGSAEVESQKLPAARQIPLTIPIFPLPEAALFPNVTRPLHIFEPRYRTMIADALNGDGIIGMVTLKPGYESEYEGRPSIFEVGCAGTIISAQELPDGRYNVVLHGLVKFRVAGEDNSRPYRLAHVEALPETLATADAAALARQREHLEALLEAASNRFGFERAPRQVADADVVNTISQYLEVGNSLERQYLLERDGVIARAAALIDLVEKLTKSQR